MHNDHLLLAMNQTLLHERLLSVKQERSDDCAACFFYLGLHAGIVPVSVYANVSYEIVVKDVRFVKAQLKGQPQVQPNAILLDGKVEGLIREPVLCSTFLHIQDTAGHDWKDAMRQFNALRYEFTERNLPKLLDMSNPASLLLF